MIAVNYMRAYEMPRCVESRVPIEHELAVEMPAKRLKMLTSTTRGSISVPKIPTLPFLNLDIPSYLGIVRRRTSTLIGTLSVAYMRSLQ